MIGEYSSGYPSTEADRILNNRCSLCAKLELRDSANFTRSVGDLECKKVENTAMYSTTSKNDGAPDMMARQIMFFLKFVTLVPVRTGTWYGTQATYYRSKVLSLCTVIIGRDCVVDIMNFYR